MTGVLRLLFKISGVGYMRNHQVSEGIPLGVVDRDTGQVETRQEQNCFEIRFSGGQTHLNVALSVEDAKTLLDYLKSINWEDV